MVARARFLADARRVLALVAFLALYVGGGPWLVITLGYEVGWLVAVQAWTVRLWPLLPALALLGLLASAWSQVRAARRFQGQLEAAGTTWLLLPNPSAKPVAWARGGFWHGIGASLPRGTHLTWEVVGARGEVLLLARCAPSLNQVLANLLVTHWPGGQLVPLVSEADPLRADAPGTWWVELRPVLWDAPLTVTSDSDPLFGLLEALAHLGEGTRAGVQLAVRADPFTRGRVARRAARVAQQARETKRPYLREQAKRLEARTGEGFLEVRLVVWAAAPRAGQARAICRELVRLLRARYGLPNMLKQAGEGKGLPVARAFPLLAGKPWAESEVGTLAHLVGQDARGVAETLRTARARPLRPSRGLRPPRGAWVSPRVQQMRKLRGEGSELGPTAQAEESEVLHE